MVTTTRFDIAEHLDDEDAIAIYLSDALETGEIGYITHAISTVARARGMSQVARDAGITRAGLYKALSEDSNPTAATLLAVLKALGVSLVAKPAHDAIAA